MRFRRLTSTSPPARSAEEVRTRERAYYLWEAAGRPEGRADEFWFRAEAEERTLAAAPAEPAVIRLPARPSRPWSRRIQAWCQDAARTAAGLLVLACSWEAPQLVPIPIPRDRR